jgi:ADP-heptose:LPS heptosyltransferase
MSEKSHIIVTLKAYGDFVIAANVMKNFLDVDNQSDFYIVAGEHVRSLAEALNINEKVFFLGGEKNLNVPAIYDIKNRGCLSAARSLLKLRQQIGDKLKPSSLVFDKLSWREYLIGMGHSLYGLPRDAPNIYLAYTKFFQAAGYKAIPQTPQKKKQFQRAVIIPNARMSNRVIPSNLIQEIHKKLSKYGFDTELIQLNGESFNVPKGLDVKVIPREFSCLMKEIKSASLVVSSDSLPAHLSAFLDVPVFVLTPIPDWSIYWLPESSYKSKGMGSFDDFSNFDDWLELYR